MRLAGTWAVASEILRTNPSSQSAGPGASDGFIEDRLKDISQFGRLDFRVFANFEFLPHAGLSELAMKTYKIRSKEEKNALSM